VLTAGRAEKNAACGYVLHVVPANGGGVDRYVRDICAHRSRDCILHVVPEQCVFEVVAARRFFPMDGERMLDAAVVEALGQPSLLHVHSTLAPVRARVASLSQALGVDYVLTLHDIDFACASAAESNDEREARLEFAGNAVQRIVPSVFISGLLSEKLSLGISRQLIENGVDVTRVNGQSAVAHNAVGQFQVAVVGALGPHKGLNFLLDVAEALPPEMRVVVVGYVDGQLTPGWLRADRLWVHGAFEPRDLHRLLGGYAAQIALFPNRQPESYSYALSDVWCAGLPALGPAAGAIGERLVQTGAGWTYEADGSAESIAAQVLTCVRGTELVTPCVYRAAAALPSTENMVERLNQLYETTMRTPQTLQSGAEVTPQLETLETVAATQLNGLFFRGELTKLSGDLAFAKAQAVNADQALQSLTHEYDARGAWIATLEKSLAECKSEIARIETARVAEHRQAEAARLDERARAEAARADDRILAEAAREADRKLSEAERERELARLRDHAEAERVEAHAAHEKYAAKLQKDVTDTLAVAHQQQQTIAIYERALSMIPPWLRRQMLARAKRVICIKDAQ
jgi:glycosyltransferase involved in cell wall biosynthesis